MIPVCGRLASADVAWVGGTLFQIDIPVAQAHSSARISTAQTASTICHAPMCHPVACSHLAGISRVTVQLFQRSGSSDDSTGIPFPSLLGWLRCSLVSVAPTFQLLFLSHSLCLPLAASVDSTPSPSRCGRGLSSAFQSRHLGEHASSRCGLPCLAALPE